MLWRILLKLFFKASVPFIVLAGILTYSLYIRGGDPAGMWAKIAGSSKAQVDKLVSGVQQDAGSVSTFLKEKAAPSPTSASEGSRRDDFYTWQDDNGVTHFSSERPDRDSVDVVSVDPSTNVVDSVKIKPPVAAATLDKKPDGEQLPGVGGMVLSTRSKAEANAGSGTSEADVGGQLDPSQLLRLLKSGALGGVGQ